MSCQACCRAPAYCDHCMMEHCYLRYLTAPIFAIIVGTTCLLFSTSRASLKESAATGIIDTIERVPLLSPYTLNFDEVLRVREENMARYNFRFNRTGIDRRRGLSLAEFRDIYDGKWPVIIQDVVPSWKASTWSQEFLISAFGNKQVTVKVVNTVLDSAIREIFTQQLIKNEVPGLKVKEQQGTHPVTLRMPLKNFYNQMKNSSHERWVYLADELFIPSHPDLMAHIGKTVYTQDDMFQLFPLDVRPLNAMLLWGSPYSRSTLHVDPYNWTGTNAVIYGRKRWKMYPPGQDEQLNILKNRMSGLPLDCFKYNSPTDAFQEDRAFKHASIKNTEVVEFDQLAGELLIIPTGWFHQAFNVEETLAISGQVMNENNYRAVLEEIFKANHFDREKFAVIDRQMHPMEQVADVMELVSQKALNRESS